MNFRIRHLSVTCLVLFVVMQAGAQSAQEIVARHIEAMGGKERLQSMNSLYLEGVTVLGNGTQIGTRTWKVYDRLYRQELASTGGNAVLIVTPRQGWSSSPSEGGEFRPLPEVQRKTLIPEIDPAGPLMDYSEKGCRVDLLGRDTVSGNDCYRLRLSCPRGQFVVYSIDVKTYYILREVYKGWGMVGEDIGDTNATIISSVAGRQNKVASQIMVEFSDYKKRPDGYVFPYTIIAGSGVKTTMAKIEINRSVDVEGLSRPK